MTDTANVSVSSASPANAGPMNPVMVDANATSAPVTPAPTTPTTVPVKAPVRKLRVRHATHYTYDTPVERSKHVTRLRPVDNWKQHCIGYSLAITPAVEAIEFEDVFGNWQTRFEMIGPYTELTIEAVSEVELLDVDPFAFAKMPMRPTFPLSWMPWEQKMLQPYLTPEELPETQLRELYDYGMSFVERNNHDLMETLFAINLALFREYKYTPGSTNFGTTAFDVLCNKKGVCQDFSNLFITVARLLGIPARYVCGYLYTGNAAPVSPSGETRAGSDATHAWVNLYIPNVGWKSFDPTNGVLPNTGHIQLAYGRNYRDATPTSGTLYTAAKETLTSGVTVEDLGTVATNEVPTGPLPP